MTVTINGRPLSGSVAAVPSKSDLHRLLICAALSDRRTVIGAGAAPLSDDVSASVRCLRALGASIEAKDGVLAVTPVEPAPRATLDVGESGSTFRFLLPVAAALGVRTEFILRGRLSERPTGPLFDALRLHGASVEGEGTDRIAVSGKITGGEYLIDAGISSQFVTGILFALAALGGGSVRLLGKAESTPYIMMTLGALSRFGVDARFNGGVITVKGRPVSPGAVFAEGDWSSAAFWLCAGAASGGVTVTGLDASSRQGDRAILGVLRKMGATVTESGEEIAVSGGNLRGIVFDASDCPDLVPPVAALAAVSDGETVVRGASRLRIKESDRLAALASSLGAIGADIKETGDGLVIRGRKTLPGGDADSFSDHRIAMAVAVASVRSGRIALSGAGSVGKSYPGFWQDFRKLGGNVDITEEK
ncbi:MAG: 3-phosphoshikimate 1-carboxyvinyltransferase [Clostridia bacterium]|nr:3-phosphoshikimate 1-carboxyvinyltransferase [Clostridia bacterium]